MNEHNPDELSKLINLYIKDAHNFRKEGRNNRTTMAEVFVSIYSNLKQINSINPNAKNEKASFFCTGFAYTFNNNHLRTASNFLIKSIQEELPNYLAKGCENSKYSDSDLEKKYPEAHKFLREERIYYPEDSPSFF